MKSTTTPLKRDTGKLIAKNLIILVVLLTVCSLSIWAWFASETEAEANGISIKAKANGVQVSWDGENYYNDLTALSNTDESFTSGKSGLAKFITGAKDTPYSLKLITGNGVDFFEPYLNRRTGEAVKNNGVWQGVTINESNSQGRFVDVDLYFRGTSEGNVWLHQDSTARPLSNNNPDDHLDTDPTVRTSDYGGFTRDYIAGASRMAFFDRTNTNLLTSANCKFTWAPNANVHLEEGEGYTIHTEFKPANVPVSGTSTVPQDMLMEEQSGVYYYLWLPVEYSSDNVTQFSDFFPILMEFRDYDNDGTKGLYAADYKLKIPSSTSSPSIPFFVTKSTVKVEDLASLSYTNADFSFVDNYHSRLTKDQSDGTNNGPYENGKNPYVAIGDGTYYVDYEGNSYPCNILYYSNLTDKDVDVTIAVNTEDLSNENNNNNYTRAAIVVGYSGDGKTFDRSGTNGGTSVINYYLLENGTHCALANPAGSVALSSVTNQMKDIKFKDTENSTISPFYISLAEQFTVEQVTLNKDKEYDYTYKFLNKKENKYLAISQNPNNPDEGIVGINTTTGMEFSLEYIENVKGPVLKSSNGYYLVFENGSMKGVKTLTNYTTALTVFTGDSYTVITNYDVDMQTYSYYHSGNTSESVYTQNAETGALNCNTTTIPLYASPKAVDDDTDTIGVMIAELKKADETSEFYTAKITMRIWVEGTDNEAQIPLAEGRFNFDLHFTNRPLEESTE